MSCKPKFRFGCCVDPKVNNLTAAFLSAMVVWVLCRSKFSDVVHIIMGPSYMTYNRNIRGFFPVFKQSSLDFWLRFHP